MIKVINKGYTITVVSWENDGDNYNTKSITVDSIEKAKANYKLMQLCESKNNQPKGVIKLGNTYGEFSDDQIDLIRDFFNSNPIFGVNFTEDYHEDDIADVFSNEVHPLLGSSGEDFTCRVMESCTITYSDKDIFVEEIKF